jgi:hypothetical protein
MARAQGARAQMALAFETTYGTPPASGYRRMPFASVTLGAEQPLVDSELLGYGRDPLAPIKDAATADGNVVVPIDADAFGFWLKVACWHRWVVQPMYQRRVEFGEPNSTVEIGGATVRPGDLIVADGDGAIVVPQDVIDNVLHYAKQESENDRHDRSMLFEVLGIDPDESTKSMFPELPPHPYKKKRKDLLKRLGRK